MADRDARDERRRLRRCSRRRSQVRHRVEFREVELRTAQSAYHAASTHVFSDLHRDGRIRRASFTGGRVNKLP
jgi:hypothetical protein